MGKRGSLSEFQAHLASRLAVANEQTAAGLLGFLSGPDHWLVKLADSGEVAPLPALTSVPLTRRWFVGIANIRGNLYAVTDFSAFQGKEATPQNASSRLLLIGTRHGNNAALLVTRLLGLRSLEDLTPATGEMGTPAWASEAYVDKEGRRWQILNVRALFQDDAFMAIGV